jgi:predicted nucleic acid-binding Zn ribbon protein
MPWEPLPSEYEEPAPFAKGLDRVLRHMGTAPAQTGRSLVDAWPDLVGEGVAAHARPGSIRGGVLTVLVDGPAWVTELKWLENELVDRLAESLGPGQVRSLSIKVERPESGR